MSTLWFKELSRCLEAGLTLQHRRVEKVRGRTKREAYDRMEEVVKWRQEVHEGSLLRPADYATWGTVYE